MIEQERVRMGLPADFPLEAMWPDGIRRERQRTRESLAFISQHPIWYAGVMLHRMWGMLKTAGKPLPFYGTSGINVTSSKCLPPNRQGGLLSVVVKGLGMIQSVARYALMPLALVGLWFGYRRDWRVTSIMLITIVYYLGPGTLAHTEIRYVLPIHYLFPVFAGLTIVMVGQYFSHRPTRRVEER